MQNDNSFDLPVIIISSVLLTGFIYIWNINKASAIFTVLLTSQISPTLVVGSTKASAETIAKAINRITKQGE